MTDRVTTGEVCALLNRRRAAHADRAKDTRENQDVQRGMALAMSEILNRITAANLIGRPIDARGD